MMTEKERFTKALKTMGRKKYGQDFINGVLLLADSYKVLDENEEASGEMKIYWENDKNVIIDDGRMFPCMSCYGRRSYVVSVDGITVVYTFFHERRIDRDLDKWADFVAALRSGARKAALAILDDLILS